jgi:hypothetical protein
MSRLEVDGPDFGQCQVNNALFTDIKRNTSPVHSEKYYDVTTLALCIRWFRVGRVWCTVPLKRKKFDDENRPLGVPHQAGADEEKNNGTSRRSD